VRSHSAISKSVLSSPRNSDTTPPMKTINYTVESIIISSLSWSDVRTNRLLTAGNLKNFGEGTCMMGRSVSGSRFGRWILEMIGDFEILVQVNLTEF